MRLFFCSIVAILISGHEGGAAAAGSPGAALVVGRVAQLLERRSRRPAALSTRR